MSGLPELMTLPEVAAVMRAPLSTIRGWIATGKLPSVKFGRHRLVDRKALALLIERHSSPFVGGGQ